MTIKLNKAIIRAKEETGIPEKCFESFLRIKVKD